MDRYTPLDISRWIHNLNCHYPGMTQISLGFWPTVIPGIEFWKYDYNSNSLVHIGTFDKFRNSHTPCSTIYYIKTSDVPIEVINLIMKK